MWGSCPNFEVLIAQLLIAVELQWRIVAPRGSFSEPTLNNCESRRGMMGADSWRLDPRWRHETSEEREASGALIAECTDTYRFWVGVVEVPTFILSWTSSR